MLNNHLKKIIIVLPVMFFLAACAGAPAKKGAASNKFSDQPYFNSSYLVSSDSLSPDAQQALSGFHLEKQTSPDGTTLISLKAQKPEYHDQQYNLKPGEQLYFIDKFLADDSGGERMINDDTAVVVDSQGNVVEPPKDWSK
jgi:hypothetical protein